MNMYKEYVRAVTPWLYWFGGPLGGVAVAQLVTVGIVMDKTLEACGLDV